MIKNIIDIIVIFISIIATIICKFTNVPITSGYELLWIHPLIFSIVYMFIYIPMIRLDKFKVTVYSVIVLSWLRCVAIPVTSALSGVYNGVSYIYVSKESIEFAILLVAFELIVTSIVLYILVNTNKDYKKIKNSKDFVLELKGSKKVYILYILFAIVIYILIGRNLNIVNFLVISPTEGERQGDILNTNLVLIRQIIICATVFLFAYMVDILKHKYDKSRNIKYVYYSILFGIFNICIIVGERRSVQIYTCLVVLSILLSAFKNHKRKIIFFIVSSAGVVLLLMSIYKHFSAFIYGSYIDAIKSNPLDIGEIATMLQSYFFGTQNVATAIEFKKVCNLNILNMLYDFGRSTFGLSFLLKGDMSVTSQYFNMYIYSGTQNTGHIISGVSYGYIYLGTILSPFIVSMNMYVCIKLESWLSKINSYELIYIIGYVLVRFSTNIYVSSPQLINLSSIMFVSCGLIYIIAVVFKKYKFII